MNTKEDHIYQAIKKERARQDEQWGLQEHHPYKWFAIISEEHGKMCQAMLRRDFLRDYSTATDTDIIKRAQYLDTMCQKAINVAACCVAMIECIERMGDDGLMP